MHGPSREATVAGAERARDEVADIVRAHGEAYRRSHAVSPAQAVALRAIARCRTAALGGHVEACDACGARQVAYNSCRNRSCPKCQGGERAKWLAAQHAALLPVEYVHIVFTLPHALNALVRVNPRRLYALLFRAAAATLQSFARDPRHLGAELGVTAVLHTWGQNLSQHVHVHCLVTGGGLTPDGRQWVSARPGFLFRSALSVRCSAVSSWLASASCVRATLSGWLATVPPSLTNPTGRSCCGLCAPPTGLSTPSHPSAAQSES